MNAVKRRLQILHVLFVLAGALGVSAILNMPTLAYAQTDTTVTAAGTDPFANVSRAVCNVAIWLRGPVGIAIGFLVLVGGLIAMQVANRDAIPMITRALIGTALLMGAGTAFTALVTAQTNCN
jgi:hypothetical protein